MMVIDDDLVAQFASVGVSSWFAKFVCNHTISRVELAHVIKANGTLIGYADIRYVMDNRESMYLVFHRVGDPLLSVMYAINRLRRHVSVLSDRWIVVFDGVHPRRSLFVSQGLIVVERTRNDCGEYTMTMNDRESPHVGVFNPTELAAIHMEDMGDINSDELIAFSGTIRYVSSVFIDDVRHVSFGVNVMPYQFIILEDTVGIDSACLGIGRYIRVSARRTVSSNGHPYIAVSSVTGATDDNLLV